MVISSSIVNEIYSNLGGADCKLASNLNFIAIRKNTRVEVNIPIIILFQNDRWIVYELDGSLFEVGEHNYFIKNSALDILELGILNVTNGKITTVQHHGSLEGEKGEFV